MNKTWCNNQRDYLFKTKLKPVENDINWQHFRRKIMIEFRIINQEREIYRCYISRTSHSSNYAGVQAWKALPSISGFLMTSLMIFTTRITENIKGSLYFILISIWLIKILFKKQTGSRCIRIIFLTLSWNFKQYHQTSIRPYQSPNEVV